MYIDTGVCVCEGKRHGLGDICRVAPVFAQEGVRALMTNYRGLGGRLE